MSLPPEEPTRPLPPARPVEYERERVVEPEFDPRYALASLEDRVRSLRTAVVLLGLVSLAALALAFYALIQAADDEGGNTRGADQAEVNRLEDRVERLEDQEAPDADAVNEALDGKADAKDVEELQQAISDLQEQPAEAQPDEQTTQALEDLSQRLDDLEQRVEQQEQQAP